MKHTKERIAKIAETKNNASRQSVLNSIKDFTLKQDRSLQTKQSNRHLKHITLEEYTEMLKSGMSPKQIIETTSKHVIYFYNALLNGKIKLEKSEFQKLYESGIPLTEIAAKSGVSKGHITYLRDFYGIKRKGATFQKRLANEVPLSDMAKSIIIGSVLGDGHIATSGIWSEKHSLAQADYLRWKASFVPDILTDKSFLEHSYYDKRSKQTYSNLTLSTRTHSWLKEIRKVFYRGEGKSKIKIIPENIIDMLDEVALAVWFMDDGSTDWGYRNGRKRFIGTEPQCKIHTECFTLHDVKILCSALLTRFGLSCKPCLKDSKCPDKWVIRLNSKSSRKLTNLLDNKIPTMQYKANELAFLNH